MKRLLLLVLVVVATSCVTEKKCNRKYPPVTQDSVYINTTTTVRDTIVFYQLQTDTIEAVVPTYKPSFLSNRYCTSTAFVRVDSLYHTLTVTAQELPVTVQIKYVDRVEYRDKKQLVPVRYTPQYIKLFAWIGLVSVVWVLIRVGLKFLKP